MSKFSVEKDNQICELYKQGKSTVEIGKIFNTYNTSIRRALLRNNITMRSFKDTISVQKFSKDNLFESNNLTREESYFFGLLVTDGCLSNCAISLSLKEEDIYMLEKFAKFLGDRVKVNSYFAKNHNKYQYAVKARNKVLCENLNKLAIFENKSFDLDLKIPLNFDILRGIIDGDGSVGKDKSQKIQIFSNSECFLNKIHDFLLSYEIKSSIKQTKSVKMISVYKHKDILFLYDKMYYLTDLFLIRKKDRYGSLLKKFNR